MGTKPRREEEAVLAEMAMTRVALQHTEDDWKDLRALSKKLTLELITDQGFSVAKAAKISGHHRQTITIWLNLHNAEQKSARK